MTVTGDGKSFSSAELMQSEIFSSGTAQSEGSSRFTSAFPNSFSQYVATAFTPSPSTAQESLVESVGTECKSFPNPSKTSFIIRQKLSYWSDVIFLISFILPSAAKRAEYDE